VTITKSDPWAPFDEINQDPWAKMIEVKKNTGKRIIGHVLPDVPEELIHAAGAIPVALAGAGIAISLAQAHIPSYSCSHAMGTLELQLKGILDILDGVIIPYVCDTTRNLYHLWRQLFPNVACEFLRLPKKLGDPDANQYLREEYIRISKWLTGITGKEIDRDNLADSISVYSKSRDELKSAYLKMQSAPSTWSAQRVISLFDSSFRFPREEHLALMNCLPWDIGGGDTSDRAKIYVRGKVWDPPEITKLFDELGFTLVGDEIVTGFRSVMVNPIVNDDLFQSLVDRHMSMTPYTGYYIDPRKLVEDFLERIRACGAQGVVFLNPKFCEAAAFDTPDFVNALKKDNVPNLVLETSTRGTATSQIRLRLEAFKEILAGDLP
jgi:benzoyl-CoA reductase/2-hydroxyglutaryl-CoA dehydratase subunit BcrC/BadD/HgdB